METPIVIKLIVSDFFPNGAQCGDIASTGYHVQQGHDTLPISVHEAHGKKPTQHAFYYFSARASINICLYTIFEIIFWI